MVTDDLIRKFLSGGCDASEAELVTSYFAEHPEVLEKWMGIEELLENGTGAARLEAPHSLRMLEDFRRHTYGRIVVMRRIRYSVTAAALIAGIIIAAYWYNKPVAVSPAAPQVTKAGPSSAPDSAMTKSNLGSKPMRLVLSDGSFAILDPGASLSCRQPFEKNTRKILLKGGAFFEVATDKERPFTVAAEGFTTTVLGTSFKVIASPGAASLSISLYSGAVSVDKTVKETGPAFRPLVLKPGQQVTIRKDDYAVELKTFPVPGLAVTKEKERDGKEVDEANGRLSFQRTSLDEIFQRLERKYAIHIGYDPAVVAHKDFTGIFKEDESIESILGSLTGLYNLELEKNDKGFIIKK